MPVPNPRQNHVKITGGLMSVSMSRADRISAVVFFLLGIAMLVGGYTMDRLEIRRIHPASIPGLLPMILGGLLALCAVLLYRQAAEREGESFMQGGDWQRLLTAGGMCLVYAVVLVGWLPYWLATLLFVSSFTTVFSWPDGTAEPRVRALCILRALVLGGIIAGLVSYMFSEIFLVRLP